MSEFVALVGGPMDGQWFTAEDWGAYLDGAVYMVTRGQRRSAALAYVPTLLPVEHPRGHSTAAAWYHLEALR